MSNKKNNKIATVWLLMVVIIIFGQASQFGMTREGVEVKITLSTLPKINEIFTVRAKIIGKKGLEENAYYFQTRNYEFRAVFSTGPKGAVKILDKNEVSIPELRNGWTKEIECRMQIIKLSANVSIHFELYPKTDRITNVMDGIELYLLDSLSGQYGTKEEHEGKLPVEYRYDPIDGSFTCSPSQNPAPVEENRRIIRMIKQLEPALSDSEALLLHSDQYRVGHPKGIPKWDKQNQRWLEEEIFEYYLKDNWFKALREGKREEWLTKEKQKIADTWKKRPLNFFVIIVPIIVVIVVVIILLKPGQRRPL